MLLNYFEESIIKNSKLPVEWQSQSSLDELQAFLQLNWEQRSVFYDDGKISSRQQYLGFGGQKAIRTNNYIGTIAFKGQQLNIFPPLTGKKLLTDIFKNKINTLRTCSIGKSFAAGAFLHQLCL